MPRITRLRSQPGSSNPLNIPNGAQITSSNQIVSLAIYDAGQGYAFGGTNFSPITIVGFLQVFINAIRRKRQH
jgi:hypothetical protein